MGAYPVENERIQQVSDDMRKRAAIALATVNHADLLVIDEAAGRHCRAVAARVKPGRRRCRVSDVISDNHHAVPRDGRMAHLDRGGLRQHFSMNI